MLYNFATLSMLWWHTHTCLIFCFSTLYIYFALFWCFKFFKGIAKGVLRAPKYFPCFEHLQRELLLMLRQREKVQCSNVELKEDTENLGIKVENSRNMQCNYNVQ